MRIGVEACDNAQYWTRTLNKLGHTAVFLILVLACVKLEPTHLAERQREQGWWHLWNKSKHGDNKQQMTNGLIRSLSQPYLGLTRLERNLNTVCPSNLIVQFA